MKVFRMIFPAVPQFCIVFDNISVILAQKWALVIFTGSFELSRMATVEVKSSAAYLLICGYIRKVEEDGLNNNQIIPESINFICYEFYYFKKLLFCITCDPVAVHTADINFQSSRLSNSSHSSDSSDSLNTSYKTNIINHKPLITSIGSLFITNCCSSSQLSIYPKLNCYKYNPHSTITLFKCGGWDIASSHALLIDTNTFYVHNWVLPKICRQQSSPYGNSMTFRPKTQQLFSIGGNYESGKCIKTLDFHDKDAADWKWENCIELENGLCTQYFLYIFIKSYIKYNIT